LADIVQPKVGQADTEAIVTALIEDDQRRIPVVYYRESQSSSILVTPSLPQTSPEEILLHSDQVAQTREQDSKTDQPIDALAHETDSEPLHPQLDELEIAVKQAAHQTATRIAEVFNTVTTSKPEARAAPSTSPPPQPESHIPAGSETVEQATLFDLESWTTEANSDEYDSQPHVGHTTISRGTYHSSFRTRSIRPNATISVTLNHSTAIPAASQAKPAASFTTDPFPASTAA
jgi:hypothetical protein